MNSKDINIEYFTCPIRQVISKFGDKWSLLVLYHLHQSETGVLRFSELHRQMSDCSQKMLSQTLKNLEKNNTHYKENLYLLCRRKWNIRLAKWAFLSCQALKVS